MAKTGIFTLEWDAHEYEHKDRSQDWFWAAGIITVSLVIVCVLFGNIIFGILILVSAFSLALFINREPGIVKVAVNEKGVKKDHIFYPFETLDSFWIDTVHPHNKIILKSKKRLMPLIIVPLNTEINEDELRDFLLNKLDEEYHTMPLVEKILEYLGF